MTKLLILLAILILLLALRKDAKCADQNSDGNYDFGSGFVQGSDILSAPSPSAVIAKREAAPRVAIDLSAPTLTDKSLIDPSKPYFVGKLLKSRILQPARIGGKTCDEWPELVYKLNATCVEFVSTFPDFVRDRAGGMSDQDLIAKYGIGMIMTAQQVKC